MNELISIVIPVYNVEPYLNKCLESIINQTYNNLEIIIIDDGSTDNSGKICDSYAKIDQRIKVIHKSNEGQSKARNIGIEMAKGNFIGFVDSDDYIKTNMFEILFKNIKEYNADISISNIIHIKGKKRKNIESHQLIDIYDKNEALKQLLQNHITNYIYNKLYRKELWKGIRFPIGKLLEDMDVMYRILEKANKIVCTNETEYYYIWRKNSSIANINKKITNDLKEIVDKRYNYLKKIRPKLINLLNIDKMINVIQYHYNLAYCEEKTEYFFENKYIEDYKFFHNNFKKYKNKILYNQGIRKKLEIILLYHSKKGYYNYTVIKKKTKNFLRRKKNE